MTKYNGWNSYETWNVFLWLGNDESMNAALEWHGSRGQSYTTLVRWLAARGITHTGDGIAYASRKVSRREITKAMSEIK